MKNSPINWSKHFELQKKSGLSIEKYCRSKGLRVNHWYKNREQKQNTPDFLQIVVKESEKKVTGIQSFELKVCFAENRKLSITGSLAEWPMVYKILGGAA